MQTLIGLQKKERFGLQPYASHQSAVNPSVRTFTHTLAPGVPQLSSRFAGISRNSCSAAQVCGGPRKPQIRGPQVLHRFCTSFTRAHTRVPPEAAPRRCHRVRRRAAGRARCPSRGRARAAPRPPETPRAPGDGATSGRRAGARRRRAPPARRAGSSSAGRRIRRRPATACVPAGARARKKCVSKRIAICSGVIQRLYFTSSPASMPPTPASSASSRTAAARWAASPSPSSASTAPPGKTQ